MKMIALVLAFVLSAASALARVGPILPRPMEEAPVERAIANVTADRQVTEVQRQRLLGRLHLIAYAQANVRMQHYATG